MKKNKLFNIIIFLVVLLIPIIYSFFYLKSYWNPYGNLTDMKIAVVNLDKGEIDQNQGEEFLKELKDSKTFNICDVSLEEANKGLEDGKYYAVIKLPEDFTKSLNSAKTENKQVAIITYTPNQEKNYLATQIIGSAVKTIETNLQGKVSKEVVATLSENIEEVPESLQEISDGSEKILSGAENLQDGIQQLNNGTNELSSKYTQFDNGISSAYSGSSNLTDGILKVDSGINTVANGVNNLDNALDQINEGADKLASKGSKGINQLQEGINSLKTGANSLNTGVNSYVDGANTLANGTISYLNGSENLINGLSDYVDGVNSLNTNVGNLLDGIVSYCDSNPEALNDINIKNLYESAKKIQKSGAITNLNKSGKQLKQGAQALSSSSNALKTSSNKLISSGEQIKTGSNNLAQGVNTLAYSSTQLNEMTSGILALQDGLKQAKQGAKSLSSGATLLQDGSKSVKTGSNTLENGLKTLQDNSGTISSALTTLNSGTNALYSGSLKLTDGVQTLKTGVDEGIEQTNEQLNALNGLSDLVEDPVEFLQEPYGDVATYGIAFTPLFLCIGLWVGSLMCYVVLYYDQKNRFGILGSHNVNKLIQNLIYIIIGAIEGLITAFLLKLGLGYEIQNLLLYYGSSILIGITFMSIIQFLIRNFGDIGKFLGLIILVLQLAAAGGTFPIETISQEFRAISSYLPMTYAINLLREILVPTATNFSSSYITILLIVSIVCIIITYAVDIYKMKSANQKQE